MFLASLGPYDSGAGVISGLTKLCILSSVDRNQFYFNAFVLSSRLPLLLP